MSTSTAGTDLLADTALSSFYAEEHLVMHQYMYESTTADALAWASPSEAEDATTASRDERPTERTPARVRIRAYP